MTDAADSRTMLWGALKRVGGWFAAVAKGIGWVVSRIVLTVVYFLVFAPARLVLKLCRVDPMQRRTGEPGETYYIAGRQTAFDGTRCRKMH